VLGWSPKIPAFLRELSSYREEAWEVDVFSRVDPGRRAQILERHGVGSERPTVRHLEGDLTVHAELVRVNPLGYDGIVLPGGDAHRSGEEADARTLLGALLLRELSEKRERVPPILVELLDPANESLLARGPGEVLVTPILVSHVLAQVALRPELRAVFDELFTAGGPEIRFLAAAHWGLAGRVDFPRLQAEGAARGATVLGVRPSGERPELNPDRGTHWDAGALDLVLLWTPDDGGGRGGGAADGNGNP
jgi:ion channel POLLUX/CASTOR